jgi:hypothetical protein
MFHFPAFPPHCLCVQQRVTAHDDCRVSPFGHPRITARLTAPRGLSRPPTSFIGSWYQGIHRAPLTTWPQMLASTVQFSNNDQPPRPHTHQPDQHNISQRYRCSPGPAQREKRSFPQDPTARPTPATHEPPVPRPRRSSTKEQPASHPVPNSQRSTHEQPSRTLAPNRPMLLRKEVIQPHLPVRLPCYDFVPIAGPTFDGSPHKGWATGFGCYRLS